MKRSKPEILEEDILNLIQSRPNKWDRIRTGDFWHLLKHKHHYSYITTVLREVMNRKIQQGLAVKIQNGVWEIKNKYMRFLTEQEFKDKLGPDWRDNVSGEWCRNMDYLFGHPYNGEDRIQFGRGETWYIYPSKITTESPLPNSQPDNDELLKMAIKRYPIGTIYGSHNTVVEIGIVGHVGYIYYPIDKRWSPIISKPVSDKPKYDFKAGDEVYLDHHGIGVFADGTKEWHDASKLEGFELTIGEKLDLDCIESGKEKGLSFPNSRIWHAPSKFKSWSEQPSQQPVRGSTESLKRVNPMALSECFTPSIATTQSITLGVTDMNSTITFNPNTTTLLNIKPSNYFYKQFNPIQNDTEKSSSKENGKSITKSKSKECSKGSRKIGKSIKVQRAEKTVSTGPRPKGIAIRG